MLGYQVTKFYITQLKLKMSLTSIIPNHFCKFSWLLSWISLKSYNWRTLHISTSVRQRDLIANWKDFILILQFSQCINFQLNFCRIPTRALFTDRREQPGSRVPGRVTMRVGHVPGVGDGHPNSEGRGPMEARCQEDPVAVGGKCFAQVSIT